jgi:hypothetical protein
LPRRRPGAITKEFPMQEHAILKRKIDRVEEDVEALKADFRRARTEIAALQAEKRSGFAGFWDRNASEIGLMIYTMIVSICAALIFAQILVKL